MEENKNFKKESKKVQIKLKLSTLIILTVIIVIILASNVFAGIMGYGNIFFMIKNLVTTGTLDGKEEIFLDKEITISYATIEILNDVELQVNKLQIRENNSTLIMQYKDKRTDKTTITFELLDSESNSLCSKTAEDGEFQMNIDRQIGETEKLSLVVKNDNEYVKTLVIDLQSREILVEGEEVSKISEIELKKYLGAFALLKNDMGADELVGVSNIIWGVDLVEIQELPIPKENTQIIEEFWGREQPELKDGIVNVTGSLYEYDKESNVYAPTKDDSEYKKGVCLSVEDISYKEGIYTVKYIYGLINKNDDIEEVKNTEYVLSTIKLKYNPDAKYSKFKFLELVDSEMIDYTVDIDKIKNTENIEEVTDTKNFTNSGFKATDKFNKDISAKENAYIALEKMGEKEFMTEEHEGYYTYIDDWRNKYNIKRIISTKAEFIEMSNKGDGALFRVNLNYENDKNEEETLDLAVIVWDNGSYYMSGPFDNYTGSTHYTKFVGLYSEDCEHSYKIQMADYSTGNEKHATLDGTHNSICEKCGDKIEEKHKFDRWNSINDNTAWTLWCTDCNRYVYTEDYDEVLASGYPVKDNKKSASYIIKNDKFQKGKTYRIWYFFNNSLESYKGIPVACVKDGEVEFTMNEPGEYSIGVIIDDSTNETIVSDKSIKLELKEDGTVNVK